MIIQELDLEIRHRPGRTNLNADAWSRNPESGQVSSTGGAVVSVRGSEIRTRSEGFTVDQVLQEQSREIVECQSKEPQLSLMMEYLEKGTFQIMRSSPGGL